MVFIESAIAVISVIVMLNVGVIVGREFGTFEKFAVAVIEHYTEKITGTEPKDSTQSRD